MAEVDKQQELMRRALQELRDLRAKLADAKQKAYEPVAVIGIGCKFPSDCDSPEALWAFLAAGKNAKTEVPAARWAWSEYYDSSRQTAGKMNSRYGSFINDVDRFDADFFNITGREAEQMDPQQRLLLETSWQAFERCGIDPKILRNSRTSVFIGCMTQEYSSLINNELAIDIHTGSGNAPSIMAGRLAYYYGLQGAAMVVDTACSSSLMAIHLAVNSLRNGEADMALAGGVNLQLSPRPGITESQAMMLAEDGLCKTFDDKADGIGRGDGVGLVVLKRLSDALQNGDPICALIKGSAANHDGRSSGLTVPSERAQEAVLKAALDNAQVQPEQISYVEAHGTGTSLGDPIEVSALNGVLGKRPADKPLTIGSLKTNFGHTEGAAGIAGFIKTVLMLQHKMLVPHLNFNQPSSHIPWQEFPIQVVTQLIPWQVAEGQRRIAGVSAFGLSGTNVHVILQQAEEERGDPVEDSQPVKVLKLSANSTKSLKKSAQDYQHWLAENKAIDLSRLCYYAATARSDMGERAVIVADNQQQFEMALSALATGQENADLFVNKAGKNTGKLALLFTGQGSQYSGMGKYLYARWPVFKHVIDECATYLDGVLDVPLQYLLLEASESELQQTRYAQPAIFAFDYALYRLWQSWGIEPDVVMGHSLGEYVAACVAGVFNLQDAIQLVVARAELMQQVAGDGAMLAVIVDYQQLPALLTDDLLGLAVAAINSPGHCVLSGDKQAIEQAQKILKSKEIHSQLLQVSHAFHSSLMQPMLSAFGNKLSALHLKKPYLPLISNVTGELVGDEVCTPDYWLQHCRQPVLFLDGVKALQLLNVESFLECGARPILSSLLIANTNNSEQIFASVHPDQSGSFLRCAAKLYVQGLSLNWQQIFQHKPAGSQPVLPVYPFSGKRYWLPQQALKSKQNITAYLHPLVHRQLTLANKESIYFESDLSIDAPTYLAEHKVYGQYLAPLAVLLEMVLATARQVLKLPAITLKKIQIKKPLVLPAEGSTCVQIEVKKIATQHFSVSIFSCNDKSDWQRHLTSEIIGLNETAPVFNKFDNCEQSLSTGQVYQLFKDKNIDYGNSFKVLENIRYNAQSALTQIKSYSPEVGYLIPPTLLDGCMQTAGVAIGETNDNKIWLPVAIEQMDFYQSINNAECFAQVTKRNEQTSQVDIQLGNDKAVALKITAVSFQPATEASLLAALDAKQFDSWLYQTEWQKLVIKDFDSTGENQLVLCLGAEQACLLADELASQSIQAELISPEQMLDARFWQSRSSGWQTLAKPLQCIYCAKDFIGNDEASASLGFLVLIKALEKQALDAKVTLLTQQASGIENTPVCPKQNAVIGLLKTAALEFPQRHWSILDVEQIQTTDTSLLVKALLANNEQHLALRGDDYYGTRLTCCKQDNSAAAVNINANKSYLVTGGAGALGFAVVEWLVEQGAKIVVIAGRSGLSSLAGDALQKLTENGAKIIGVEADLSQASGGDTLLTQLSQLPPLAGVIHAAGVLKDSSLLHLSAEDFVVPWQAKVKALAWLDKNSPVQELDFFVLFSSLAAVTGAPGQGNYAAANAYADALMLNRQQRGLPALTINWGGWRGDGMLAETETAMTSKGLDLIEPEQGIAVLQSLLSQSLPQVAVMPVRWAEFFTALPYEAPAFYQQFMADNVDKASALTTRLIQQLNELACEQRSVLLDQSVRQLIAQILRTGDNDLVLENRQGFFDIGFDSLLAMELTNRLSKMLDYQLPSTLLFDYPTLEALLSYLEDSLPIAFKPENTETTDDLDDCSEQEISDLLAQRLASMD